MTVIGPRNSRDGSIKQHKGLKDHGDAESIFSAQESARRDHFLQAMRSVLQLTNRVISGQKVTVELTKAPHGLETTPGWSEGATIHLNEVLIRRMYDHRRSMQDFVMVFKGTGYHENSHVILTPREEDTFKKLLMQHVDAVAASTTASKHFGMPLYRSWNILEDQRIETLYTTMYPATRYYFVATVLQWLLFDVNNYAGAYPLVYGRKYLPVDLRDACRKAFVERLEANREVVTGSIVSPWQINNKMFMTAEAVTVELERLIDQFILTVWQAEPQKMVDLTIEYHELLQSLGMAPPNMGCSERPHTLKITKKDAGDVDDEQTVDVIYRVSKQLDKEKQDRLDRESKKADKSKQKISDDAEVVDIDDVEWDYDEDESDSDDGEDEDDEGDAGDDDSAGDGDSDSKSDKPLQKPTQDGKGGGAGQAGDTTPPPAPKDGKFDDEAFNEMLEDELAETLANEDFQSDIRETSKSISSRVDVGMGAGVPYKNFKSGTARPEVVTVSNRIAEKLRRLYTDVEPSWQKPRSRGRLVGGRFIKHLAEPTEINIFRKWDAGNEDDATTEVVILLDLSGSMSGIIYQCSEALWILKRAFDRVEIRTTVLGFSNGNVALYKPEEKIRTHAIKMFSTWAGTDPTDSLKKAHAILQNSDATNRIMIAITDGMWAGDENQNDALVSSMRKFGASTVLFCFGNTFAWGSHNAEIALEIQTPQDVTKIIEKMVTAVVANASTDGMGG